MIKIIIISYYKMNQVTPRGVPTYVFNSNSSSNTNGNNFRARPLQQWRKQLSSSSMSKSTSNSSIGMPMDRPSGTIPLTSSCNTYVCSGAALLEEEIIKNPSACTSCEPIKLNTRGSDDHYTDNNAYMQSRCITYNQKLAYNPAPFVTYLSSSGIPIEPSDSSTGTQVRETNNCYGISNINSSNYYTPLNSQSNSKCSTTIYKPNNSQFAQQGGVSSSSRLARLKYNTLNNNGSAYHSASGAIGVNTGLYQTEPSPSYYNKLKPQKVVYPYKIGASTYCKPEYICT